MPVTLNNAAVTRALQRVFGFKGRFNPVLDEVVVPVYSLTDSTPQAPQPNAGGQVISPPAGAGSIPVNILLNPAGSGLTVTVEAVSAGIANGGPLVGTAPEVIFAFIQDTPAAALTLGGARWRDDRFRAQVDGEPIAQVGTFTRPSPVTPTAMLFAGVLLSTDASRALAQASLERQPIAVLPEGKGLAITFRDIDADTATYELMTNYVWREVATNIAGAAEVGFV